MSIDVAPVVSMVIGTVSSVGAVGAATLGIKSLVQLAKTLREEMGMGMGESLKESRRIHSIHYENDRRNSMSPEQRQAEDDAKLAAFDTPENRQAMKQREADLMWMSETPENRQAMKQREASFITPEQLAEFDRIENEQASYFEEQQKEENERIDAMSDYWGNR